MKNNNLNKPVSLLINPFNLIAGTKSLLIGFSIIVITSVFAYYFNTHFNGVLDIKYGDTDLKYYNFLLYGIINVVTISVLLYFSGLIVSKSSIRFIDVIGTQALARYPLFIAPFLNAGAVMEKFASFMMGKYVSNTEVIEILWFQWVLIGLFLTATIILIIWMIVLMYNAYCVSSNVRGNRAVISFIIALLLAEAVSIFLNIYFNYNIINLLN